jgi:rod shape-determining protein MreB
MDLGSSTVRIYVRGVGVVVDEPAPLALDHIIESTKRVVATGRERFGMLGWPPEAVEVTTSLWESGIADRAATERMLQNLIGRAQGAVRFFRPEVVMAVPSGVTSLQRRAITEAAISAGARQAWLLDQPLAAAIGADLAISEPRGQMVCDIGAAATEIAVISLSGMVVAHSTRVGGRRLDQAIVDHLRRRHGLLVGERTAAEVKVAVGAAIPPDDALRTEVGGRELGSGLPMTLAVSSTEIAEAIQPPLAAIGAAVRQALEQAPAELACDVRRAGIVLAGGGALLRGIDHHLSRHTGFPARVAADPRLSVARGAGLALDRFDVLRRGQLYLR